MDNRSDIVQEYVSSLRELRYNSKPLIKMLTQLAAEGQEYAEDIFAAIKTRLSEVPTNVKLPILYLIDSIIKNVGRAYIAPFCKDIVSILIQVYLQMDEKTQKQILKLRQTWNGFVPPNKLKLLDINIAHLDPTWRVATFSSSSHFNSTTITVQPMVSLMPKERQPSSDPTILALQQRIMEIRSELVEIQQRKWELDRFQAEIKLQEERIRQNTNMGSPTSEISHPQTIYVVKNETSERNSTDAPAIASANTQPIGDLLLRCLQQQENARLTQTSKAHSFMDTGTNSNLSDRYYQLKKNSSCDDCSLKIGTERDHLVSKGFTKGTKRSSSESIDLLVYKKTKSEMCNGSSASEVTLARRSTPAPQEPRLVLSQELKTGTQEKDLKRQCMERMQDEMKENCHKEDPFKEAIIRTVADQIKKCGGAYPKIRRVLSGDDSKEERIWRDNALAQKTSRWGPSYACEEFSINDIAPSHGLGIQLKEVPVNGRNCTAQKENQALNVNELLQKMVAKGMLDPSSLPEKPAPRTSFGNTKQKFFNSQNLKIRQPAIIQALYQGQQCSSCGLRFPPEENAQYSEHLDWHFRQNRKVKEHKIFRRSWHCSSSDWTNYHDDLDGKEKNYFEKQKEIQDGSTKMGEEANIPCIRADADVHSAQCEVCQDSFEQFYDEDADEWLLRMAVRVEGKTFHPLCYQDNQIIDQYVRISQ